MTAEFSLISEAPGGPVTGTAPPTVLCVDDEPNVLSALRRALRSTDMRVLCADGGDQALSMLAAENVALVLSDMRMPNMNGAQLLEQVRLRHPDTVRVLLTGHADISTTIAAINRGSVYRYLQKPWDDKELQQVIRQGIELHALTHDRARLQALTEQQNIELRDVNALLEQRVIERTAELAQANDRLKRSYLTTIKVFSNVLELRDGRLAGHGRRVAELARRIAHAMAVTDDQVQVIFVAGLLHDVGLIGVADSVLGKPVARHTKDDAPQYRQHSVLGEQSLMALEDLQATAALIRAHHERFDGNGWPDRLAGSKIPLGARILAVADTFDDLQSGHLVETPVTEAEALTVIHHGRGTQFDPEVMDVFLHITAPERLRMPTSRSLRTGQLQSGMVLAADLLSARGMLMIAAGQCMSVNLIDKIRAFEAAEGSRLVLQIWPESEAGS